VCAARLLSLSKSSGVPSESGESGGISGAAPHIRDPLGAESSNNPDEELNANDVQEDNNNDEGMMDDRVVSKLPSGGFSGRVSSLGALQGSAPTLHQQQTKSSSNRGTEGVAATKRISGSKQ
jgi:hypothetical protein